MLSSIFRAFSTGIRFGYILEEVKRNIILKPVKNHRNTLIWMHGLGDSAYGFLDVFYNNKEICPKSTKIILLTAPYRPVTINGGMYSNSWYDILSLNPEESNNLDLLQIQESEKLVSSQIQEELTYLDNNPKKIIIGGFSQGCVMSLLIGLNNINNLGGLIGLSGYLIPKVSLKNKEEKKNIPIFLYHGINDEIILVEQAEKSYQKLMKEGFNIQFTKEKMLGHGVSDEELLKMRNFLHENLKDT